MLGAKELEQGRYKAHIVPISDVSCCFFRECQCLREGGGNEIQSLLGNQDATRLGFGVRNASIFCVVFHDDAILVTAGATEGDGVGMERRVVCIFVARGFHSDPIAALFFLQFDGWEAEFINGTMSCHIGCELDIASCISIGIYIYLSTIKSLALVWGSDAQANEQETTSARKMMNEIIRFIIVFNLLMY